jgi:3-dehydroquinate synthase
LRKHKEIMKDFPRNGEGLDAFVDASDTGFTMNPHEEKMEADKHDSGLLKKIDVLNEKSSTNGANGHANGVNGSANGTNGVKKVNGHANGTTNGHTNGTTNGTNGHSVSNGVAHDRH